MFGKKDDGNKHISNSSSPNVTYVSDDCEIKGSIESKGNARIDGKVEGTIKINGDLIIGQNAVLKANAEANTISIAGEIRGNVKAKELLELAATARVYGDISTKFLRIDQGARFVGKSNPDESAKSPQSSADNKPTAENEQK